MRLETVFPEQGDRNVVFRQAAISEVSGTNLQDLHPTQQEADAGQELDGPALRHCFTLGYGGP